MGTLTAAAPREGLGEVVAYFLRLGLLGFGGPVAFVGRFSSRRPQSSGSLLFRCFNLIGWWSS